MKHERLGTRESIRQLAEDIAKDSIVTQALARLIEQIVRTVYEETRKHEA